MSSRKALGRGLAAIIPQVAPAEPAESGSGNGPSMVPLDRIQPNPKQPRRQFDESQLEELAASLREHGVLEPVIVRPVGENYELVVGERRWRAARLAGLTSIPAIVRNLDDRQVTEIALVENLQREDLNAMEEAEAYLRLMTEFGLTQEQVAERVGKQRSTVANRLRLLDLESDIQEEVRKGRLSAGHARALLAVPTSAGRRALAWRCMNEGLSVRDVEAAARQKEAPQQSKARRKAKRPVVEAATELEEELQRALGTRVRIVRQGQSGRIEIEFYSDDDITRIYELIVGR